MRSQLIRRVGAGLGLAAAIVLGTGATAFAHECINSSRSDKGNEKAGANSQAWFTIHVEEALAGDVADGLITGDQAACILEEYSATGSPMSFTIHVKGAVGQDGTIGSHNPNEELMSDGRGIDHFIDLYGAAIFGSYAACDAEF
jgi:hypothetical protein